MVQGVGFRPAMYRLADSFGLGGFVRNDREGVWIEVEGWATDVDGFVAQLSSAAPDASRIDTVETATIAARGEPEFRIVESAAVDGERAAAGIPADLAPCADCLRELDDPANRRHRYPFINCTACGPRFTIVRDVPYDRAKTTMTPFEMCDECRREYEDPADRRFHAEPNACPACGPHAQLVSASRVIARREEAVALAARALRDGAIVAVKGAGGFVLAVDATNESAVVRLRERKRRPHKPFAVMARSLVALDEIAVIDDLARTLLVDRARPIVLAPMRRPCALALAVAPGLGDVGVYLPPTPLQHLLLAAGPALQVMTSGNLAEEPIARTNGEALDKLASIADVVLLHDREIHARSDDSVVRVTSHRAIPMRRARGFVPDAIRLPVAGPSLLAVGGHERNTVCLVRDGQAVLSQHVGDLDHIESERFFSEVIDHLHELVGAQPVAVAHDLHPDYRSTRWALRWAQNTKLPRLEIQHHHAHVAACLAEHGRTDRVAGVAFDGTGLGPDGSLWGGEILAADLGSARRLGHLRALALPGGEVAIREPWRVAAAALLDAGESLDVLAWVPARELARITALLSTDLPVRATGAGRWFDAVAALLGIAAEISYDAQAAAQLEAIAAPGDAEPLELRIASGELFEIDLRPAIREIAHELRRGTTAPVLAARFHATLVLAIRESCHRSRERTVVLTGGCFQNRRLVEDATRVLEADGFEVLTHERVPPNDGGLALGQAAIASFQLATRRTTACA